MCNDSLSISLSILKAGTSAFKPVEYCIILTTPSTFITFSTEVVILSEKNAYVCVKHKHINKKWKFMEFNYVFNLKITKRNGKQHWKYSLHCNHFHAEFPVEVNSFIPIEIRSIYIYIYIIYTYSQKSWIKHGRKSFL